MAACREVGALLDRHLDGEVTAAERAEVEEHLVGCPECSRRLRERRAAMSLLAEWAGAEAAIRPAAPVGPGATWLRAVAAAAAMILAGALAWQSLARLSSAPAGASGHSLAMRSLAEGVTVVPGMAGEPDELVVDAFPVRLCWQPMSSGVEVIRSGSTGTGADELVVDPFPVKMRPMSSGVVVVPGRSGEPAELVVDPFPEEGK
jgi:hypothetical protein